MDIFVAAVFDNSTAAYRAVDRIRELHKLADIHVFSGAVIAKDPDGNVLLESTVNEGPVGTATGYWVGALIGVLAGPAAVASGAVAAAVGTAAIAGAAIGGLSGSFLGMARDLTDAGLSEEILDAVATELRPGHTAVVALIDELATLPLDEAVAAENGKLFRKPRTDVTDERIVGELGTAASALSNLRVEFLNATAADRDLLKVKGSHARSTLEERVRTAKERIETLESELKYRTSAIDEQVAGASQERLEKLRTRRTDLRSDFTNRLAKLKSAIEGAEAALAEDDW